MSEQQGFLLTVDGQEVAVVDYVNAGRTGGLATDRAIAELLRMTAFDGTNVYKTILPSYSALAQGGGGASATNPATVTPGPGSNGSVQVNPFTALIGSRATPATSPTDPTWTGARQNLSDIRTSVYTGTTTLATLLAIAANASGTERQDLIYATVSVDVQAGATVRRVKNASSGTLSTPSVPTYAANTVTVGVVAGTPGANPTIPALPADSGGNYNVAIASVFVPNGFGSSSSIATDQIRDVVGVAKTGTIAGSGGQTVAMLAPSTGAHSGPFPASGNNDRAGTLSTNFPWVSGGAGFRPAPFLPPSMIGGSQCLAQIDLTGGSPSHAALSVVDDTIDWRNRFILALVSADGSAPFAGDPSYSSGKSLPAFGTGLSSSDVEGPLIQMNNSFSVDGIVQSGAASVFFVNNAILSTITSPGFFGLYVSPADGILRVNWGAPIAFRFFVWLMFSAQFPNR